MHEYDNNQEKKWIVAETQSNSLGPLRACGRQVELGIPTCFASILAITATGAPGPFWRPGTSGASAQEAGKRQLGPLAAASHSAHPEEGPAEAEDFRSGIALLY